MPTNAPMAEVDPASFRDPSGFVFSHQGTLYRQINQSYREHFDRLIASGLYERLSSTGRLVSHEVSDIEPLTDAAYLVIKPARVPFISYPYEWSFGQLKAAALLTLDSMVRGRRAAGILRGRPPPCPCLASV